MSENIIKEITFNFTKPIKRKAIDPIKSVKAVKEEIDKRIEEYDNIVPIKTKLDIEISDKTYYNDFEEWSINKEVIKNHRYNIISPKLTGILYKLSVAALKIVGYICYNIEYNSNRIDLDTAVICEKLNINKRHFYSAIAQLDECNIMYRTVKQGIYSINPLYIFKGSLIRFIKLYERKYSDSEIKLDNKGRIIIDC